MNTFENFCFNCDWDCKTSRIGRFPSRTQFKQDFAPAPRKLKLKLEKKSNETVYRTPNSEMEFWVASCRWRFLKLTPAMRPSRQSTVAADQDGSVCALSGSGSDCESTLCFRLVCFEWSFGSCGLFAARSLSHSPTTTTTTTAQLHSQIQMYLQLVSL